MCMYRYKQVDITIINNMRQCLGATRAARVQIAEVGDTRTFSCRLTNPIGISLVCGIERPFFS